MESQWFLIRCRECGAQGPIIEAHHGEVEAVELAHANNCPYLIAVELGGGSAVRYIAQFGSPIQMVRSPHKDN